MAGDRREVDFKEHSEVTLELASTAQVVREFVRRFDSVIIAARRIGKTSDSMEMVLEFFGDTVVCTGMMDLLRKKLDVELMSIHNCQITGCHRCSNIECKDRRCD